ncbi:hypothetical protein RIF23_20270 [Lipingzhangella sp. LS1_29]|uniref:Uncharacterized protein n=1 Tax=Lipingzhangella rawalii TaxID=2055835 RepID=A0ABU2HCA0_9ACTN|nr:hypothetical protein [Lipingzhangella rawalii]MDS1272627.1 hypothetical protein [Lipingzhangella rawalii]
MVLANPGKPTGFQWRVLRQPALRRLLAVAGLGAAAWLCGGAAAAAAEELPVDPSVSSVVDISASGGATGADSGDDAQSSGAEDEVDTEPVPEAQEAPADTDAQDPSVVRAVGAEARSTTDRLSDTVIDTTRTSLPELDEVSGTLADPEDIGDRAQESLAEAGAALDGAAHDSAQALTGRSPELGGQELLDGSSETLQPDADPESAQRGRDQGDAVSADAPSDSGEQDENTAVDTKTAGTHPDARANAAGERPAPAHEDAGTQGDGIQLAQDSVSTTAGDTAAPAPGLPATTSEATAGVTSSASASTVASAVAADLTPQIESLRLVIERIAVPDAPTVVVPGATEDPSYSPD